MVLTVGWVLVAGSGQAEEGSESFEIVQEVAEAVYGLQTKDWRIESRVGVFDAFYDFECQELLITVNDRGGYVSSIVLGSLLDTMPKRGYVSEEEALAIATDYVGDVVGFIPDGKFVAWSNGRECIPQWRVDLERYTSTGVFVDWLIKISIYEGNVISYLCTDDPLSDVRVLPTTPKITAQEAEGIARAAINSAIRQLFDKAEHVELGFTFPMEERESVPSPHPTWERTSTNSILVWKVWFDDLVVIVDSDSGEILRQSHLMSGHNWTRETLCVLGIIGCILAGSLALRKVIGRFSFSRGWSD